MPGKLLENWESQKAALDEKIRMAKSREKTRERKADNKRRFLIGAMVLGWMEEKPDFREEVIEGLQTFLKRASDRRYFGFPPLSKDGANEGPGEQDDEADEDTSASAA